MHRCLVRQYNVDLHGFFFCKIVNIIENESLGYKPIISGSLAKKK